MATLSLIQCSVNMGGREAGKEGGSEGGTGGERAVDSGSERQRHVCINERTDKEL